MKGQKFFTLFVSTSWPFAYCSLCCVPAIIHKFSHNHGFSGTGGEFVTGNLQHLSYHWGESKLGHPECINMSIGTCKHL